MLTSPLFYTEFFVHMKYKTGISDWQAILQQAVLVIQFPSTSWTHLLQKDIS